jgi:hypothetical protein
MGKTKLKKGEGVINRQKKGGREIRTIRPIGKAHRSIGKRGRDREDGKSGTNDRRENPGAGKKRPIQIRPARGKTNRKDYKTRPKAKKAGRKTKEREIKTYRIIAGIQE